MDARFKKSKLSVSSELYDDEYYKYLNRGFSDFKADSMHPNIAKAIRLAGSLKGQNKRILDIGCGRGEIVYFCALSGCQAFGIDYSKSAVAIAKDFLDRNLPLNLRHNAQVELLNAKELKYENCTFDIVFMIDVVEHLYDYELKKVFAEVKRVLKPSGKLIIHTSPNRLLMNPVRFFASLIGMSLKSDKFHVNEQSAFSLKKHLKKEYLVRKILIEKDKHYWVNGTLERGFIIRAIVRVIDWCVDNFFMDFIIRESFLKLFLGNDIWAVAQPKKI